MALASIVFVKNPLALAARPEAMPVAPGTRPYDWLKERYPEGCGGPVRHIHNGVEIPEDADDWLERPVMAGECCVLAVAPAGIEVALTTILITALVTAVVSAAVSIGLSLLFPDPTAAAGTTPSVNAQSPVYSVRSRQNLARLGEPVPVVYGNVLMTPDLCAAPYNMFTDGQRAMHVDLLLCLGHGFFAVHEVLVGETETSSMTGAQWIQVTPNDHGGQFGHLGPIAAANGWSPGFIENAYSSLEVGEQRFTNAGDVSGYFRVGRAGVSIGQYLYVNIEWPRGLYQMNDWGDVVTTHVDWNVHVVEADIDGNPVGAEQVFPFTANNGQNVDPLRRTYQINCGRPAAWLVKLQRVTVQFPNGNEFNEFYWRSLTLECGHNQSTAYGAVTLLMVRLKAEQVASTAERLVRVRCTRLLSPMGNPVNPLAPTASPADAFIDIMVNPTYGAGRPLEEVDYNQIALLRTYWLPYEFNGAYTQKTTVWQALTQTVQGVAAAPLPIGGLMSVAQDGLRPARSMMFSEQNIVRGSFKLSYHFEQTGAPDGVEIEYVEPYTWTPAYQRWPLASVSPERMNLFGCSSPQQAAQFARLQWQRRQMLRRLVEFSTELEGLIPHPAERIAVAHTLPRWGVSGYVALVDGLELMLDRVLPWDEVAGPYYMMFRNEHSGASNVVEVVQGWNGPHWVTLTATPWGPEGGWVIGQRQEGTHFTWGDGERVVKDFTLTALAPKGGQGATTVDISGVVYDPDVYFGTLAHLQFPVP